MHPLEDNIKASSFEDLERRKTEIMKRMQIMRRNGIENSMIWNQLELLLDGILAEQEERFLTINNKIAANPVVVNTDPLPSDESSEDKKPRNNNFTPIS